ncbi:MAG: L,D-transpeptidase family protein [Pseudomonadales bacterium]|nr:L,D-transpeptidase family protein [Pseudomonadales bacterium]
MSCLLISHVDAYNGVKQSWLPGGFDHYQRDIDLMPTSLKANWYDENHHLAADMEEVLHFIGNDKQFLEFAAYQQLPVFAYDTELTGDFVPSLDQHSALIARLLAWYLVLEHEPSSLANNPEWQQQLQWIHQQDISQLHRWIINNDQQLIRLRRHLYRYINQLDSEDASYQRTLNRLEIDDAEISQTLRLGDQSTAVLAARALLHMHGFPSDLSSQAALEGFDQSMQGLVKQFQRLHQLKADGIIGDHTWSKLKQKPFFSLTAIRFTLAQLRQQAHNIDHQQHIVVNIPAYQLLINHQAKMRVIVGSKKNPTPLISDQITRIVLNPEWGIPKRIMRESIQPQLAKNPDYLQENHIYAYEYRGAQRYQIPLPDSLSDLKPQQRLIQSPGKHNALGQIKFITTNKDAVILHDTNNRHAFKRDFRALSNGCVRLQKPWQLYSHLQQQQHLRNWPEKKLKQWLERPKTTHLSMQRHANVHLVYWLAWVDQDQNLHVYPDIYDLQQQALSI